MEKNLRLKGTVWELGDFCCERFAILAVPGRDRHLFYYHKLVPRIYSKLFTAELMYIDTYAHMLFTVNSCMRPCTQDMQHEQLSIKNHLHSLDILFQDTRETTPACVCLSLCAPVVSAGEGCLSFGFPLVDSSSELVLSSSSSVGAISLELA